MTHVTSQNKHFPPKTAWRGGEVGRRGERSWCECCHTNHAVCYVCDLLCGKEEEGEEGDMKPRSRWVRESEKRSIIKELKRKGEECEE